MHVALSPFKSVHLTHFHRTVGHFYAMQAKQELYATAVIDQVEVKRKEASRERRNV